MFCISYAKIKNIAYMYLVLPLLVFLFFYMESIIGIAGGVFLLAVLFVVWRKQKEEPDEKEIVLSWKLFAIFAAVAVVWTFLGGFGNHYSQSDDWNCRNAIFRDLIYRDWPVVYENYDKALVYYIGYWLPSAAVVKVVAKIFPVILTTQAAFVMGNQLLWAWTAIGIFLLEVLLATYVRPASEKKAACIPLILVFFSGLDIIGTIYMISRHSIPFPLHIEWWAQDMQFSSITTCLFWVFNQSVIAWIVSLCMIQEKTVRNYILLGVCALISGPIPFLGIFVYMVSYGVVLLVRSIRGKTVKAFIREVFSLSNCLALVAMPIIYLYYTSNSSVSTVSENAGHAILGILVPVTITWNYIKRAICFLILEVGVYYILIFRRYRREPFYYITIASSCIAPFFLVGYAYDFVMRFSIPAIMVLAAMCMKFLLGEERGDMEEGKEKVKTRVCRALLCAALFVGSFTPMTEFMRGYYNTLSSANIANVRDNIVTLDQDFGDYDSNFVTYDYKEQPFFKYLVK